MRQKKGKWVLAISAVGTVLFVLVLWLLLRRLEAVLPTRGRDAADKSQSADTGSVPAPVGTVKLNGQKYDYYHRIKSYLFIGTDYSGQEKTEGTEYVGAMADFLALLAVDQTAESYGILQLNRDTMMNIRLIGKNGKGEAKAKQQLCTAHWYGGNIEQSDQNMVEAVERLLGGIKIDWYYTLNIKDIPKLNQAVDGVEVTVEDDFSESDPSLIKGETVVLTDDQAFHFVHDRMNVGDGENISRMCRQKAYMEGWRKKASEKLKEDSGWLNALYEELMGDSSTDLEGRDISRIVNQTYKYNSDGIRTIDGTVKLGKALGDGLEHTEYYLDKQSLCETMKELYSLEERGE